MNNYNCGYNRITASKRNSPFSIKSVLSMVLVTVLCFCGTANSINTVDIITG